jgi:hypothetical protein
MESPYFTVEEVATLLRKSTKWVYAKKHYIPGYFKLAGSIFFDGEILTSRLKELASKPYKKPNRAYDDRHGLL